MMRFRRRAGGRLIVDGLSERDAARLESFLRHPSTIPGMEGLESHSESKSLRARQPTPATPSGPIKWSDELPRKRGRRV